MTNPGNDKNNFPACVGRRAFFGLSVSAISGLLVWRLVGPESTKAGQSRPGKPQLVEIAIFTDAGARQGLVEVPRIVRSESEWRRQLGPLAFEVTRRAGTEPAFTGAYWNLHKKGLYHCVCCNTALFSSQTKFQSGTGWPSFWEPIARENIRERRDLSLGMVRTEVSCRRCDAHLGHVFDDGPKPTGLRYCMNSAALRFIKSSQAIPGAPPGGHPRGRSDP